MGGQFGFMSVAHPQCSGFSFEQYHRAKRTTHGLKSLLAKVITQREPGDTLDAGVLMVVDYGVQVTLCFVHKERARLA